MTDMKFFNGTRVKTALLVIGGIFLFGIGVAAGYHNRPEINKVMGITNILPGDASTSPAKELETCIDAKGEKVPCLLNRDEVQQVNGADADFEQFWKVWNIINDKYVPTKHQAVTNQEKVWGAIGGLADSLGDPYTYFMPPQEKSIFEQDVSGSFGGVGMQIGTKDGLLTVIAPLKGSPAERAGIKKGDKVLLIDGATTTEMTVDKALYLIRGEIGKKVRLTVYREGVEEPLAFSITREVIQVPTIDTELRGDVFIIRLYGFPATGADLFRNALREFVESKSEKLVLDLRGNPGGYLEVAVDMASWFLPQGAVVVSEEEKTGMGQVYRSKGYAVFNEKFHFVILVDGGSASAAEILAGALEQHGIATLVGTKTFGKGSVQELVPVTDDTAIKVTVARWVTPNGTNLSEGGLIPEVVVEYTKEDAEKGEDPQLEKAIELVKSGKFPEQRSTATASTTKAQ